MIIEDLAHSLGAIYDDGREAGTVGAFSMFSFSQDKPLDVVAGGACINRLAKDTGQKLEPTSIWKRTVNRAYPFWTWLIRTLYPIGLGRVLHLILKKLHLLAKPLGDAGNGIHKMSNTTAKLLLNRWSQRDDELSHRRAIAEIYMANLPKELLLGSQIKGKPTYLRFPIISSDRQGLINYLKQSAIYIGDTWYDAPIGPKKYLIKTDYANGQCPEAEKLAATIVNLPTHRHITPQIANNICAKIKQWQASK
jgi:dTDP-4-amino-4,6-dideoxygalactose transaminase